MPELLYEDMTEKIRQAAFEVHSYFKNGFLEKVYENALIYKMRQMGLDCQQQMPLKVFFENNVVVGEYIADIVVEIRWSLSLKSLRIWTRSILYRLSII